MNHSGAMMRIVDDDSFRIEYTGNWDRRGTSQDFDRCIYNPSLVAPLELTNLISTTHTTCAPGSSLTFAFNGVIGPIH